MRILDFGIKSLRQEKIMTDKKSKRTPAHNKADSMVSIKLSVEIEI